MVWMVCWIGKVSDKSIGETGMEDGKDMRRRS
jgi:hypothetical protein